MNDLLYDYYYDRDAGTIKSQRQIHIFLPIEAYTDRAKRFSLKVLL